MATTIEWCARPGTLPEVWNLVGGCHPKSEGCTECWAARLAATRLKHHPLYEGLTKWVNGKPRWTGEIRLDESKLEQPLHWRKPRTVFVCSTSDLFNRNVPFEFIERVWLQMLFCKQHTFLVLTKRPRRMREFVDWYGGRHCVNPDDPDLPYLNVWKGVSVENPDYLWRVEELLRMPAAVRFVSLEPLLAQTDISHYLHGMPEPYGGGHRGYITHDMAMDAQDMSLEGADLGWQEPDWQQTAPSPDQIIIGGESGPNARYCDPDWIRDIIAQCRAAGTKPFVKQLGTVWAKEYNEAVIWANRDLASLERLEKADYKGANMRFWPVGLRVREYPP